VAVINKNSCNRYICIVTPKFYFVSTRKAEEPIERKIKRRRLATFFFVKKKAVSEEKQPFVLTNANCIVIIDEPFSYL
jgi:hypothetical protein